MTKPKVTVNPVANAYTGPGERIIEYSDPALSVGDGTCPGGLIAFRRNALGKLHVHLYRHDPEVVVTVAPVVGPPERMLHCDSGVWRVLEEKLGNHWITLANYATEAEAKAFLDGLTYTDSERHELTKRTYAAAVATIKASRS